MINDNVIWHDAGNNSFRRHRNNNFNALTPNQLEKILSNYKHKIHEIGYCKFLRPESFYCKLKESSILVINIVTGLISSRKHNLTEFGQKYLPKRQDLYLELKTFTILRRYSNDLKYNFQIKTLSEENASGKLIETKKNAEQ